MPGKSTSRHLAAVMFVDMVGYSAMMQEHEPTAITEVRGLWELVRPLLAEHGGREVDLAGDGMMTEFPGALAAVECALAIHQALHRRNCTRPQSPPILVRAGVHLGDITHVDDRIYGDGVNLAARVQGFTPAGAVGFSAHVRDQLRNAMDHRIVFLGTRRAKNIRAPLALWCIAGPDCQPGDLAAARSRGLLQAGFRPGFGPAWLLLGAATMVLLLALGLWFRGAGEPRGVRTTVGGKNPAGLLNGQPVAVLPCETLSDGDEISLLSHGVAEELGSRLSTVPGVSVIGRASSRAVSKEASSVIDAGTRLQASFVLHCSLRQVADRLRMIVSLVAIPSGEELWSRRFNSESRQQIDLAAEMALSVARGVLPVLVGAERAELIRHRTDNPAALSAYFQAIQAFDDFTPESLIEAIAHLDRATELDPQFALAHANRARICDEMVAFQPADNDRWRDCFVEGSARAAALQVEDGEGRALLGYGKYAYFNDWLGAREDIEAALAGSPGSLFVNTIAVDYFSSVGPFDRAVELAERGARLDPLNLITRSYLLRTLNDARQFERCEAEGARVKAVFPRHWVVPWFIGNCLLSAGRYPEATQAFQQALDGVDPDPDFALASLAASLAAEGHKARAHELLAQIRVLDDGKNSAMLIGVSIYLGDYETALEQLEAGLSHGQLNAYIAFHRPYFDPLRENPHFIALGERFGLTPDGTLAGVRP